MIPVIRGLFGTAKLLTTGSEVVAMKLAPMFVMLPIPDMSEVGEIPMKLTTGDWAAKVASMSVTPVWKPLALLLVPLV